MRIVREEGLNSEGSSRSLGEWIKVSVAARRELGVAIFVQEAADDETQREEVHLHLGRQRHR
jgi:hypothetical protein